MLHFLQLHLIKVIGQPSVETRLHHLGQLRQILGGHRIQECSVRKEKHRHLLVVVVQKFAFQVPPLYPVEPRLNIALVPVLEQHVLARVGKHGLKLLVLGAELAGGVIH